MDSIRPPKINRPRNRIEEALSRSGRGFVEQNNPFLPNIKKPNIEESIKIVEREAFINQETFVPKPIEKSHNKKSKKFFSFLKVTSTSVFVFSIVAFVAYGGYQGMKRYSQNKTVDQNTIIDEVSKITLLPQGETPTMVTVANLEPLKGQPIFVDARVGDVLLIYKTAKKGILYRPSERRIIVNANLTD